MKRKRVVILDDLFKMSQERLSSDGYKLICSLLELQKLKKKRVTVDDRVVVLFYVKGNVYAIDHFCYRTLRYLTIFIHIFSCEST